MALSTFLMIENTGATMAKTSCLRSCWFEDIPVGEFHVFGSYTFSEQEIIDFGELYAPQIYHTDPDAALDPRYRGSSASKWHVCAVWMRLMVDYMENYARGVEDGRRNGADVRIENLEQFVPIKSGHTLTFSH
jgi:acyl dehydratase